MADELEDQFDLALWLGRHQAFAAVTSFSASADAHALLTIREQKLYRSLDLTWDEFCSQRLGFSARTAERIIANLKEFGDSFFHLTELVPVPAPEYRAVIQQAVEADTLEIDGRRIPITRENSKELIEAVDALRARAESPRQPAGSTIDDLGRVLDRARGKVAGMIQRADDVDLGMIVMVVEDHVSRLLDLFRDAGCQVVDLSLSDPLSQTEPPDTAFPAVS